MSNYYSDQLINSCGVKVKCSKEADIIVLKNAIKSVGRNNTPPVLQANLVSKVALGGITIGETFVKGTSMESLLHELIAPVGPVVSGTIYFATTSTVPSVITSEFTSEMAPGDMLINGVTHSFTTTGKQYECFAYEASYGELKHIYENNLTCFDLINDFIHIIVSHGGKTYYMYYGVEKVLETNASYKFLFA